MNRFLLSAVAPFLLCATLLLGVGTSWAGPYEEGLAAKARGDHATALTIFRPLAAQGNQNAQFMIGRM